MERNGHSRWTVPWNQYYVESIRSMWGPKNNCLHNSIPYCLLIQMQTTLQTFAKSQRYLHFSLTQRYPGKVINRAGRWRQLLRQCAVPLNGFQKCIEVCSGDFRGELHANSARPESMAVNGMGWLGSFPRTRRAQRGKRGESNMSGECWVGSG